MVLQMEFKAEKWEECNTPSILICLTRFDLAHSLRYEEF